MQSQSSNKMNHDSGALDDAFDPERFRRQGIDLVNKLADHLKEAQSGLPDSKVTDYQSPEESLRKWKSIIESDEDHDDWWKQLIQGSIHLHNPKYMGHQLSPSLPVAALAGLAGDFLNNGMGVYEMGQAATAIERLVVEAVAKEFGMPIGAGGFMTAGGTLGNLTALLTARRKHSSGDVWNEGAKNQPQHVVLVSEQAHYCVERAVRIMGLGKSGVLGVPVDSDFKMQTQRLPELLEQAKSQNMIPFAVVGSACTTSTGSFDNLNSIADFCESNDLWFHVDGAHGASAAFSKKYRELVDGIERADSVVMDFHKTMMTPALATALVYRNHNDAYTTFSQQARYLWDNAETRQWYELSKQTFECTKYMMGVKVFSIIRTHGFSVFEDYVDRCFDLAKSASKLIGSMPRFELACEPECNILCFRVTDPDWTEEKTNNINSQIREAVLKEGRFYIVQTVVQGKRFLRTTLSNPITQLEDFELLVQEIQSLAAQAVLRFD